MRKGRRRFVLSLGLLFGLQTQLCVQAASSSSAQTLYGQALKRKRAGQCDLALPGFEQAIAMARAAQDVSLILRILRHRGECYQYQGNYPLAWLDFAYGRLQTPEEARFYEALGWLSIFEGHYALARQQLEQAQRLAPDNLWVRLNLGWTYYLQGQQTEAFVLWQPLQTLKHGMYRQALRREVEQLQALPTVRQGRPDFDPLLRWLDEPVREGGPESTGAMSESTHYEFR